MSILRRVLRADPAVIFAVAVTIFGVVAELLGWIPPIGVDYQREVR